VQTYKQIYYYYPPPPEKKWDPLPPPRSVPLAVIVMLQGA
jgi:hypothetical protein